MSSIDPDLEKFAVNAWRNTSDRPRSSPKSLGECAKEGVLGHGEMALLSLELLPPSEISAFREARVRNSSLMTEFEQRCIAGHHQPIRRTAPTLELLLGT
ncbi:MAG TPA: hypothetical protein VIG36_01815, partial [Methylocystis sp.]